MIIWADFPSGQRGLYGTNLGHMSNGLWSLEGTFVGNFTALVADPDPVIDTAGVVLRFWQNGATGEWGFICARFTYPAAVVTSGIAFRLWLSAYPITDAESGNAAWALRTVGNTNVAFFRIGASGQIKAYNAAGAFIDESPPSAVEVNAYSHIETKVVRDAAAGTIEVRVNGTPKLTLTGQALGASDIANAIVGQDRESSGSNSRVVYFKDVVLWDGLGTYATDFQGSVAVYDLYTDADVSLNWVPSIGALGYPLLADKFPANTLTASGAIASGNQVRIDNTYYTFTSGSVDAGAPAGTAGNPWLVNLGADVAAALLNLYKAIGATGVAGTDYSTVLTAHTTVDANGVTADALSVMAKLQTASAIVTTETGANLAWISGTLIQGPTDPSYIEADDTPPAAAVFTMTNLPPDVTSIRALLPIFRAQKTDGGDCNVQTGLSPDNVAWVDGTDQPLTVAFNYWWSASHVSPLTAAPWTPGEVNGAYVRVNRTL